jgi:hypothetical protein
VASKVEGIQAFRQRVLGTLKPEARKLMADANQKNAQEFHDLVAQIVPRGDPKPPNLADTLVMRPGDQTSTAFLVSIGGPGAPYPLHLEGGHRTKGGAHVPAEPFWNPAKRVLRNRARRRAQRALNAAVKLTAAQKLGTQ